MSMECILLARAVLGAGVQQGMRHSCLCMELAVLVGETDNN